MFNHILVVCVGNICRSPTGEHLLKLFMPHKVVDSAGVGALVGMPADKTALEVANEYGVDLSDHIAKQLTPQLCQNYDLILVMERGHINAVTNIAPEARGKTMLLSEWIEKKDIPDPYRQSKEAFYHAYELIEKSCRAWSNKLV